MTKGGSLSHKNGGVRLARVSDRGGIVVGAGDWVSEAVPQTDVDTIFFIWALAALPWPAGTCFVAFDDACILQDLPVAAAIEQARRYAVGCAAVTDKTAALEILGDGAVSFT